MIPDPADELTETVLANLKNEVKDVTAEYMEDFGAKKELSGAKTELFGAKILVLKEINWCQFKIRPMH